MEIKTKYNIGDDLFFIDTARQPHKITHAKVVGLEATRNQMVGGDEYQSVRYKLGKWTSEVYEVMEEDLHRTKKDLIDSL